jgi:hypothetical protein
MPLREQRLIRKAGGSERAALPHMDDKALRTATIASMAMLACGRGTIAAIAVLAAGCTEILSLDGDFTKKPSGTTTTASSSSSSSSSGGGGGPGRTVSGTETITYVRTGASGAVAQDVHPDLTNVAITALVLQGGQFGAPIAGRGSLNGTFTIDNVPVGPYYLNVRDGNYDDSYFVTDSDDVDISFAKLGRPDAQQATLSTPLELIIGNLDKWAATDRLELVSAGSGAAGFDLTSGAAMNKPGLMATSLDMTIDSSKLLVPNLINGAAGDAAGIIQLKSQSSPVPYFATTRFVAFSVTQLNGMMNSVSSSFVNVGLTTPAQIDWHTTAFEAQAPLVNPGAAVTSHDFKVQLELGDPTYGIYSVTPDIVTFSPAVGGPDVSETLLYDRPPIAAAWYSYESVATTFRVLQQVPGGTATASNAISSYVAPAATFASALPIIPKLSPPKAGTIDGASFFTDAQLKSLTPTLTWQPPDSGAPTSYTVRISSLSSSGQRLEVAKLVTDATTITVPAGLLVSGTYYVFNVRAMETAGVTYSKTPASQPLPFATASTMSGVMGAP